MEADCQVAAVARVRGAAVATQNVRDFEGCDVEIVDPFQVFVTSSRLTRPGFATARSFRVPRE
jgi:hypothetical protein